MKIPPRTDLIEAAKVALKVTDDLDLAIAMRQRYGLKTTQSSISRWKTSPRGPSYEASFALMQIAGWLISESRIRAAKPALDAVLQEEEEADRLRADAEKRSPGRDRESD